MKRTLTLFISLFITYLFYGQGFNYKALISENGNPVSTQIVNVRFTILDGATTVYQETHTVNTDEYGIFSANIGEGSVVSGDFNNLDFRNNLSLKVEVDTGSGYQDFGTEEFKYVPYAKSADYLKPTDYVEADVIKANNHLYVGQATTQNELLFVAGDPAGAELAEFKMLNTVSGNDILQLTMDAPSSGTAQFIEGYTSGLGTVFQINHNGDIITDGSISLDGNVSLDGDINIGGKIKNTTSGNTDLKAYVYGYITSSGAIDTSKSSNGFTVTKTATGIYKITLTGLSSSDDYIAIVSPRWRSGTFVVGTVDVHSGYFYVDIYNSTGNHVDNSFYFVVYKK